MRLAEPARKGPTASSTYFEWAAHKTQDFTSFAWEINNDDNGYADDDGNMISLGSLSKTIKLKMIDPTFPSRTFKCNDFSIFHHHIHSLNFTKQGRKFFKLNGFSTFDASSCATVLPNMRKAVEDELEKLWGSGYLAEKYMVASMNNKLALNEIREASPLILKVLGDPQYDMFSPQILAKACNITDDEETFTGLLTLPLDALNSF